MNSHKCINRFSVPGLDELSGDSGFRGGDIISIFGERTAIQALIDKILNKITTGAVFVDTTRFINEDSSIPENINISQPETLDDAIFFIEKVCLGGAPVIIIDQLDILPIAYIADDDETYSATLQESKSLETKFYSIISLCMDTIEKSDCTVVLVNSDYTLNSISQLADACLSVESFGEDKIKVKSHKGTYLSSKAECILKI